MQYLFLIAFLFKCGWEFFPRVIFCLSAIKLFTVFGDLSIRWFIFFCFISESFCKMGTVSMAGTKKVSAFTRPTSHEPFLWLVLLKRILFFQHRPWAAMIDYVAIVFICEQFSGLTYSSKKIIYILNRIN